ncbi:MAG: Gfo/Idh/MocA family oxidoreductase [Phycisphaerae bacterium]|jgi:predicted dehydrogenase
MSPRSATRRTFLSQGLLTGAAGWAATHLTAASYARVIGANDRINLGLIGCGGRGPYILREMIKPPAHNTALVCNCDIWKQRREGYPAEAEKHFGQRPRAFEDYRKVLDDADVDAVVIATPDHQHAIMAADAIHAGKHVYVEKPIVGVAEDLVHLNRLYDVAKASKMVVQHGTQGVSSPGARAVRQVIADGTLGRLFRVEGSESWHAPYWMGMDGPKSEADTNWKAFLFNRKERPFDAFMAAKWFGFWEFTSGAVGGWMSHYINAVHYVTGCGAPVAAAGWGGKYAPNNDKRCTAPDNLVVVLEYAEGFHAQFTSHFGNTIDNETMVFMFEKGTIRTRFGHDLGNPVISSEGVGDAIKPRKLLDADPPYPGGEHAANWLECIRAGRRPNADMDAGYKQGVAVVLGDLTIKTGRKVTFDGQNRELRPLASA